MLVRCRAVNALDIFCNDVSFSAKVIEIQDLLYYKINMYDVSGECFICFGTGNGK